MTNIEFLDCVIKAYKDTFSMRYTEGGDIEINLGYGHVPYGGITLNDAVQDMRNAFSESYLRYRFQKPVNEHKNDN